MRVSSVGWLYNDLETVRRMARLSADVTHNHPEGIKGAVSVAGAVYLARTGSSMALTVIMMLPPIIIYMVTQSGVTETMSSAGIKE